MVSGLNVEDSYADLGILKNGAEELCGAFSLLLGTLAFRNVLREIDHILRLARGVAQHEESAVGNGDVAITANESLFPFVTITVPLQEFSVPLRAGGALIRMDNLIPSLEVAELFLGVTQHLVQGVVREMLPSIDTEEVDADLRILENGPEKLRGTLAFLLCVLTFCDVFAETNDILRPTRCVADQPESAVGNNNTAIAANEALRVFILIAYSLDEI